jgi:hypothetical protein
MPVKLAFQERTYALLMKLDFFNGIRSGIGNVLKSRRSSQGCVLAFAVMSLLTPEHALRVIYE